MATTREDLLEEAGRRIDRLRARAENGNGPDPARIRRHLDVLRQEEAAVHAALRDAPDEVDEKLAQLTARIEIAEHSLAADASGGWQAFAAAVEAELDSWDTYIERLQTSVVEKAWKTREQAEAAIGDVRSRRIEVDECLARPCSGDGDATNDARKRVTAARDQLEQKADELSAKLT
jgi:hypothetical protein